MHLPINNNSFPLLPFNASSSYMSVFVIRGTFVEQKGKGDRHLYQVQQSNWNWSDISLSLQTAFLSWIIFAAFLIFFIVSIRTASFRSIMEFLPLENSFGARMLETTDFNQKGVRTFSWTKL